jgi:ABC-2 type transport system permease protein
MSTFPALIKREVLDSKNGYIYVPLILMGITLFLVTLSSLGIGKTVSLNGIEVENIRGLANVLENARAEDPSQMSAGITLLYWASTSLTWIAFPFVVFFSLLGALYEERRDRSILFWKSMPISDWQEVLAKFATPLLVPPLTFLAVVIVAQLFLALLFSLIMVFQGGAILPLWPVSLLFVSWLTFITHYLLWLAWALPVLAWLLFVSSFASRMPFLWAILLPVVLIVVEGMFLGTHNVGNWITLHLGAWQSDAFEQIGGNIDGPDGVIRMVLGGVQLEGFTYTIANVQFWIGLAVTTAFLFGSVQMRKRAL